jgi:hypothetical protein
VKMCNAVFCYAEDVNNIRGTTFQWL